jgi:DNA repair ATPase RecN
MSNKISRTQQIIDEANKLLNTDWTNDDKELVNRIIGNLKSYKSFIPSSLKDDIKAVLEMANRIKKEYDELLVKFKEAENNVAAFEDKNNHQKEVLDNIEKELEKLDDLQLKVEEDLDQINVIVEGGE